MLAGLELACARISWGTRRRSIFQRYIRSCTFTTCCVPAGANDIPINYYLAPRALTARLKRCATSLLQQYGCTLKRSVCNRVTPPNGPNPAPRSVLPESVPRSIGHAYTFMIMMIIMNSQNPCSQYCVYNLLCKSTLGYTSIKVVILPHLHPKQVISISNGILQYSRDLQGRCSRMFFLFMSIHFIYPYSPRY